MIFSQMAEKDGVTSFASGKRAASFAGNIAAGFEDLAQGLAAWRLWSMLGWNDIRQRYRRSTLGPFWITASTAVFIALLGFIYSNIFHMDVATYLPYVAGGLIIWGFISSTLIESCASFTDGSGIIKQLNLPFSIFVMRTLWRAFMILLHTMVLMLPIWVIFRTFPDWHLVLVVPGLMLVMLNQLWLMVVIAVLSTRFRDVIQLISTAIQIAMFATPIMWPVSVLKNASYIAEANPLYHLIELVRAPLLGQDPDPLSWVFMLAITAVGFVVAAFLLGRTRHRIAYWL